ncbi:MAG: pantetheine-phosphate adenylyltransferase [Candidatus Omnitrophica bacterium]|nr:pantetheine-phosphate adenylyltransferase [Candidatus Omnitrophota bacterium]
MNKTAVYPGTFDPITNGHIDIIKRAARLYDTLYVGLAVSQEKKPLFTVKERLGFIKQAAEGMPNVRVEFFKGLAVDYVRSKKSMVVVRGLRMISDFEYEFQMALTNRKLADDIETIFMMPHEKYAYLSSKLIKEIVYLGADASSFVPDFVEAALRRKLKKHD